MFSIFCYLSPIQDGRKISIGDCALFKPPHDSPPFIGIIRRLTSRNDNILDLSVNWLYRPAELKLGKGILPEAAPNEIFYSFHRDEIPAASLLHPCKVAFLPKVVELPTGISSFVCRRVYDIDNKCLWWLTDQDYINERQEEVDQLLQKTRLEMHASLQPGGRSPKPTSVPMSTSHSKPGSDNMQNSVTSFSSQVKGKRRESLN
nr:BAH domain,TFIIS helical bundle-like domain isoform 1 [Ipomoea batatas]